MIRQALGRTISQSTNLSSKCYDYYITTPIFYVNSSPHIGHLYTIFVADALNIFHRLRLGSSRTIFSSGTDEHGIKIKNAATLKGIDCTTFCNVNSSKFRELFNQFDTTLTDFIRTTENRHRETVQTVWTKLMSQGYIYKSTYAGWYCNSDETFVPESQVTTRSDTNGTCHVDQNGNVVTWSEESNYLFRLSLFESDIRRWLVEKKPIVPSKFNTEALSMLDRSGLGDISVSRPSSRLDWAIRVPNDPSQTVYVWLDALSSYLTIVDYPNQVDNLKRWPIDCQVIGKDIIKFHAIYWPAFLMALSLPLPRRLLCHSHWLIDSYKMSKSRGNVVDPFEERDMLTTQGLRYFLLRSATPHSDTDYNRVQALHRVNAELADTYGNLMSRCCSKAINPAQVVPTSLTECSDPRILVIRSRLAQLVDNCSTYYENADFYRGVDEIMAILRLNNVLYEDTKPWKLIKEAGTDSKSHEVHSNLQAITFETLRVCSILLQPIVPDIANAALSKLNIHDRSWESARAEIKFGQPQHSSRSLNTNLSALLFKRILENKVES